MQEFIIILVLCLIIEYKLVYNRGYKRGKYDTIEDYKNEGYNLGVNKMEEEFNNFFKLPDEELFQRISEIRNKLKEK